MQDSLVIDLPSYYELVPETGGLSSTLLEKLEKLEKIPVPECLQGNADVTLEPLLSRASPIDIPVLLDHIQGAIGLFGDQSSEDIAHLCEVTTIGHIGLSVTQLSFALGCGLSGGYGVNMALLSEADFGQAALWELKCVLGTLACGLLHKGVEKVDRVFRHRSHKAMLEAMAKQFKLSPSIEVSCFFCAIPRTNLRQHRVGGLRCIDAIDDRLEQRRELYSARIRFKQAVFLQIGVFFARANDLTPKETEELLQGCRTRSNPDHL